MEKWNTFLIEHSTRALAHLLPELRPGGQAADRVISSYFKGNPNIGQHERGMIAEATFGVLREKRSLEKRAGSDFPKDMLIAWLSSRGISQRQLDECKLSEAEWEIFRRAKGFDLRNISAAERLNLPDWLYERLLAQLDEATVELLAARLNQSAPLDLRVNTVKSNREEALATLASHGIHGVPTPWSPLGIRLADKPALQREPLFRNGALEVQDEGSQLLALLTAPKRGEMVVDFCAGAGGKTLALGALMRNTGRLYAFDTSEKRLARFTPRFKKSGLSNVHPQRIANENDLKIKRLGGKIDRVLVDAPCSGLGTLRRNPDLKWRQQPSDVAELAVKQLGILTAAARLVKVGGRLVYATCSVLDEENAGVVATFCAAHPHFVLLNAQELLVKQGVTLKPAMTDAMLRLGPHTHGTDGFFAAVLERRDSVFSPAPVPEDAHAD